MKSERSKALHNFPMPSLKWGRQKSFKCVKLEDQKPSSSEVDRNGIEATREKVMMDIQTAADQMKDQIFGERLDEPTKPWNLKSRRAACKAPNGAPNVSPTKAETKSMRLRQLEKKERVKFSLSLSREEIEEDFMAITGKKLPRRPTKRPKALQKQLDTIFPGLWLTEITADSYNVPENAKG